MSKKVALIGLDAGVPGLIQKYFKSNKLQNMKKLAQEGCWAEGIPVFPTATASNWNTISTGAWPKTHGVTDMVVHLSGKPLTEIKSGFYSDLCQAEQIWKTCERFSKKVILLKYIGSWPPNIKNGIQVEGFGAPGGPGSRPWGSSPLALSNSSCYSNIALENANVVRLHNAEIDEWKDVNTKISHLQPLETELVVGPANSQITYNVLLLASLSNDIYDRVLITKNKDAKKGFFLKSGQLSKWLTENFVMGNKTIKATFRMKLIKLTGLDKKENFRLFISQIFPLEGWTFPGNIAKELFDKFGPFLESISHFPYVFGWIDENTYLDDVCYQAKWLGNATTHLMSKYDWHLFMMQWHGIDNTQHAFLRFDRSVLTKLESEVADYVVARSYEIADELVGDIVMAINGSKNGKKNVIDDTYIFVLSDHGHVMGKRRFFINGYLYHKGFIKLKKDLKTGKIAIDWENTRAFAQGMINVYVNLKGRDPQGAVQPGKEYENVVEELISALYDIKDPKTGSRPLSLVLSKKDTEFMGLGGERVGDVIFAANHVYAVDNRVKVSEELFEDLKVGFPDGSLHGQQLPSVDLGECGTIKSFFIAHGPNIKKGYVRNKPINAVDIAPTIAHILSIPPPQNSEGTILYDLFE
jgi:predicted AlkP superfamily phosphohydrolase/phosphomutase